MRKRNLVVKYNSEVVALIAIKSPTGDIAAGEKFFLVDSYKEGDMIWIGFKVGERIAEAGFRAPVNNKKIKNRDDMKRFVKTLVIPYIDGVSYSAIA